MHDRFFLRFREFQSQTLTERGHLLFEHPVYAGDGIMNIAAKGNWFLLPEPARERILANIGSMWRRIEGSGLPVHVNVIDGRGDIRRTWTNQDR